MIKVLVFGSNGKMGGHVRSFLSKSDKAELFCGVDVLAKGDENYPCYKSLDDVQGTPDIIIDFSFHRLIGGLLDYAVAKNIPVIIATTGFDDSEKELIKKASEKIAIFWSSNMSLGIPLLVDFAKKTAEVFPDADIEIVETHHNRKVDAPSGTALMLAEGVKKARPDCEFVYGRSGESKRRKQDVGIHALRMANIVGEHQVLVTTDTQQIVLKHTAYDRALFADGAVSVVPFMIGKPCGIYDMNDYING
ncbi:MAG: 4-hydroxy-tetrahydrodipicolinate reductase [Clostridia bacterium]|nr:4-hydroxy-tetrahydrodipicolinate reductase [Clostridia bacterium]